MTFTTPPRLLRKADWPDPATLPTMYDLPSENPEEPGLPDEFHDYQPDLLSATFRLQDYTEDNRFAAADLNLYYDPEHNWYKRPDWFAVLGKPAGCHPNELRLSYVVWQERLSPFVVVELISPGTENEDFGRTMDKAGRPPTKWTVYEQILQIPYYVIYDRYEDTLSGFQLINGQYQPIEIGADRKIWLPEAKAGLGLWQGKYNRFTRTWLRWYDENGWILTETEQAQRRAEQAQLRANQAQRETEQAQREAEQAQREAEQAQRKTEQAQREAEQAQRKTEQAQREAEQARRKTEQAQRETEQIKAKLKALGIDINDLGMPEDSSPEPPENGR